VAGMTYKRKNINRGIYDKEVLIMRKISLFKTAVTIYSKAQEITI
jgi:hypothetical protein